MLDKVIIGVIGDSLEGLSPEDITPIINGYFDNDFRPVMEGDVYQLKGPVGPIEIEIVRTFLGKWGMVTN